MYDLPILSALILLPAASAILLILSGFVTKQYNFPCFANFTKKFTLAVSIQILFLTIILLLNFDHSQWMQFIEEYKWLEIDDLKINIILGIDGIALSFILLTAIIIPICILASWNHIKEKIPLYFALLLLTESILMGFFLSLNIVLFYIFFEIILIPMLLIIGIWGGKDKIYASYKFFLYTFSGSVLMLIAIIYIILQECNPIENTISIRSVCNNSYMLTLGGFIKEQYWQGQAWVWWFIFIGLAVKVPMWPLHRWLPKTHVEAPTGGSMILAGILLKMGGYGMLRLLIDPFPRLSAQFSDIVIIISIIGIIYTSLVALAQEDMKKLIAYSSIAHMGYVTAGIFSGTPHGISGAIIQMISHGLISPALFFIVGVLYDRKHTREIKAYGGLAKVMPQLAIFFMLQMLGSIGLPGTSGFIGEFTTIVAGVEKNLYYGFLMSIGVVLGAVYMLKLYGNVMFHNTKASCRAITDISCREWFILAILTVLMLVLGIYPSCITIYLAIPLEFFGQFYQMSGK